MLRPYVMTIAGLDPSAGAGILADIKCFEQHAVYGFGVCTALTVQNDNSFFNVEWKDCSQIIDQITPLLKFKITACKIGLIRDLPLLEELLGYLKKAKPEMKIILDPILKASAGFEFHDWADGIFQLSGALRNIDLITPNYLEMRDIGGTDDVASAALKMAAFCPVLLKGGHNEKMPGHDFLMDQHGVFELVPDAVALFSKHGSGCVLSAAITANLALGDSLQEACRKAKIYTAHFLNSNENLLGYHSRGAFTSLK